MRSDLLAGSLALAAAVSFGLGLRVAVREHLVARLWAGDIRSSDPGRRLPHRRTMRRLGVASLVLVGLVLAFSLAGIPGLIAGGAASVGIPRAIRNRRRTRAAEQMEMQLAGAVSGIAAALRAGLSLSQALRYASAEATPPLVEELRAVTDREELGLPLERSLLEWEMSSPSEDVHLVANVLRLKMGSGLPAVLDEVGRALRQRQSARGEVRSLTAQAKLSGSILGFLPIGFFLFLAITSRRDMAAAYGTTLGIAAILGGLVLQVGGYLWIRRLIRVEV